MQRPPISSTSGRYELPRSRIEISGFNRAIMVKNNCAMKVLPPPDFAVMRTLESLSDGSKGEKGTNERYGVSSRISGDWGVPCHEVSIMSRSAACKVKQSCSRLFSCAIPGKLLI